MRFLLPFVLLGAAVFIMGRITRPINSNDVAYIRGLTLRNEVQELRNFEMESVTDQQQFDERLDKMNKGVEQIIEDGRKRQYSSWRSDFLAILIVVSGLLL